MTEIEAIEKLKSFRLFMEINDRSSDSKFLDDDYKANGVAVQALETVQEMKKRNITIEHIEEYMQFEDECVKNGFTFKSLLEAREKQTPKKPILHMNEPSFMAVDYKDGTGKIVRNENNWWRCPCCKAVVGQRVIVHGHIHDQRKKKFCKECGQKIDWEVSKNE